MSQSTEIIRHLAKGHTLTVKTGSQLNRSLAARIPIGTRFSTMVVVGYRKDRNRVEYLVKCDCGAEKKLQKCNLQRSKSCGCLQNEQIAAARTTHGDSVIPTKTYIAWNSMIERCCNENHKSWNAYGGRGIKVCDSWRTYTNFKSDMGDRPPGMQLDRVNNMGNYEPSNCRWATSLQNANNKRTSVFLEHNAERLTIAQWARRIGIGSDTLRLRLKAGWSVSEALTKPLGRTSCRRAKVAA